jgi:hypothetical protein
MYQIGVWQCYVSIRSPHEKHGYACLPQQKWEKWDSDEHAWGTEHAGIMDALPPYKGWDIDQSSQVLHPT